MTSIISMQQNAGSDQLSGVRQAELASELEPAVRKAFAMKFKDHTIDSIVFPELANSSQFHVIGALTAIGLGGLTCQITVGGKQLTCFVQLHNTIDGPELQVVGYIHKNNWVSSPEGLAKVLDGSLDAADTNIPARKRRFGFFGR